MYFWKAEVILLRDTTGNRKVADVSSGMTDMGASTLLDPCIIPLYPWVHALTNGLGAGKSLSFVIPSNLDVRLATP